MASRIFALIGFLSLGSILSLAHAQATPEQIHLSYTLPESMTVTWVTQDETTLPIFRYSTYANLSQAISVPATTTMFNDWPDVRIFYVYHGTTALLVPSTQYYYQVGSASGGWSPTISFMSLAGLSAPMRYAVYADFGYQNHQSLEGLINETALGHFDMVLHIGDIGYDMEDNSSLTGDLFLNMVQPFASVIPYQTCPGNHEADHNDLFYNYRTRFNMPGTADGMYYSFDLGYAHFVAISTEAYFYPPQMIDLPKMYAWLERDLAAANANRKAVPWLIVYGHRPLYCTDNSIYIIESGSAPSTNTSDPWYGDCTNQAALLRDGIEGFFAIEPLLYKYGVDLYLCGHEHSYERLYPVYQGLTKSNNASTISLYSAPSAPVHIIAGAAGNREDLDGFGPKASWSAVRSSSYGYGHLEVYNETHVHWQQVRAKDLSIVDDLWVVQPVHGPFADV